MRLANKVLGLIGLGDDFLDFMGVDSIIKELLVLPVDFVLRNLDLESWSLAAKFLRSPEPLVFGLLRPRADLLLGSGLQTLLFLPLPMEGKVPDSRGSLRAFIYLILLAPDCPDLGVPQRLDFVMHKVVHLDGSCCLGGVQAVRGRDLKTRPGLK